MKKTKVVYTEEPKDIAESIRRSIIISDFLPPPNQLIRKVPKVRVTLQLTKSSVEQFKKYANEHDDNYQCLIRDVVDQYAKNALV